MKKLLCAGFLLLVGILIGFLIPRDGFNEEVTITREPTELEIVAYLEKQEREYLDEYDEVAQLAIEGDVDLSWKMYNRYAYGERDYERAYFWAVLLDRQEFQPEKGTHYAESAEGDIKAKYWSRTRDPERGTYSGLGLPEVE